MFLSDKIKQVYVDLKVIDVDPFLQMQKEIMKDFNLFKKKNELTYCSLKQDSPRKNSIDVLWCCTVKYKGQDVDNQEKILQHYNNFVNNNKDEYCKIGKITCQDGCLSIEYIIHRIYTAI